MISASVRLDLSQLLSQLASQPRNSNNENKFTEMFSSRKIEPVAPKSNSDIVAPKPPPSAPNGAAQVAPSGGCVLSNGVSIKGSVKFEKALVIDGEIEGEIESHGRLTIGVNAVIKADITTISVVVDGTVEGNITAEERCELRGGSTVHGDIESPRLVVDEAASFIGSAKIATKKSEQR